eukprot:NODE_1626_length_889_cov_62.835714_g1270_i0.p1 GENE.NODE_1626_length_889_cov_62.835714_g1270_i0~~NODE_1626_length_889_cov_62.835714_g1270_i0.p1  ORF type:complete len:180 (-),score=22.84 NODE_1626_length_889_cov_62.835714_g1270_i0:282-821(-)
MAAPAPNLIPCSYRRNQVFSEDDDPDKTAAPHNPPSFIRLPPIPASPAEILIPEQMRNGMPTFAKIVQLLTPQQCQAIIDMANEKGFLPGLLNIGGGKQMYKPDTRDHVRCIIDDTAIAGWMFSALQPHLPPKCLNRLLSRLNERLRILCYHQPVALHSIPGPGPPCYSPRTYCMKGPP